MKTRDLYEALIEKHKLSPRCISGVGDGWIPILDEMFTQLRADGWDGEVGQIKEKFGGLRVYLDGASAEQHAIVEAAETRASKTCETCGKPGTLRSKSGWIRTACEECWAGTTA